MRRFDRQAGVTRQALSRAVSGTRGSHLPVGGVSHELVGEVSEIVDGLGLDEMYGLLLAGLAEEVLAGAEHDRVDHQPHLVDEVVLDEGPHQLDAAGNEDLSAAPLRELRDLGHHVTLEDRGVVPFRILEGGRHDVLGHAVQPVRELTPPRWPQRGQELVGPPALQQGFGAEVLLEQHFRCLFAASAADPTDPAASAEALDARWVLDDSVERDVLAYDDLPHFDLLSLALSQAIDVGAAISGNWSSTDRPVRTSVGVSRVR